MANGWRVVSTFLYGRHFIALDTSWLDCPALRLLVPRPRRLAWRRFAQQVRFGLRTEERLVIIHHRGYCCARPQIIKAPSAVIERGTQRVTHSPSVAKPARDPQGPIPPR